MPDKTTTKPSSQGSLVSGAGVDVPVATLGCPWAQLRCATSLEQLLVVFFGALRKGHISPRRSVWWHTSAGCSSALGRPVALEMVVLCSVRSAVGGLVEA